MVGGGGRGEGGVVRVKESGMVRKERESVKE